jgi:hypothetical protein
MRAGNGDRIAVRLQRPVGRIHGDGGDAVTPAFTGGVVAPPDVPETARGGGHASCTLSGQNHRSPGVRVAASTFSE